MDPTATLESTIEGLFDIRNAYERGEEDTDERENMVYLLRELAGWLERGGLPPDVEKVVKGIVRSECLEDAELYRGINYY